VYIGQHRLMSRGIRAYELWNVPARTGEVRSFAGSTRFCTSPGNRFRPIDLLLTNFHLQRSPLFMLVAAELDRIKAAYAHAIANHYRFSPAATLARSNAPPDQQPVGGVRSWESLHLPNIEC
jgi:hypothetical protein